MIKIYLMAAIRSLRKNNLTGLLNIAGLSVGMTAAFLILLWVQNELSFDRYHKDEASIYRLTTRVSTGDWVWESSPLLLADAIKKEVPEVQLTARLNTNNWPVINRDGTLFFEKNCAYVDDSWFELFHYDFIEGSAGSFNQNPFSIILTASAAKKYFGNKRAVGQSIHIDSTNYDVRAVVADAPANSSFRYNIYIPVAAMLTNRATRENDENWNNANYITFIKLQPGSNPAKATEKITAIVRNRTGDKDGSGSMSLLPLREMHFESGIQYSIFNHGSRSTVYVFSILAFLLLLIACINYVNLTTARASLRAREVSIRKINGASRVNLFFQFFIESLLVSMLAIFTSVLLVQLCLPFFNGFTGNNFVLNLTSAGLWQVFGCTLGIALLLNCIYPAVLLSSSRPLNVLKGISLLKLKDGYFRKGLVVVQFSISVILIASSLLIYRQIRFIQTSNPGYNRSQVVSFKVPFTPDMQKRALLRQTIKQELLAQSGIEDVSISNQPIVDMGSFCSGCADWAGRDTSYNPKIAQLSTDADFLKTLQLGMKEGRWFRPGVMADKHSYILNETAVRDFGLRQPLIGQRFIFKSDTGQIIGIVKDFSYKTMHEATGPLVVFNNEQWQNLYTVRIGSGQSKSALANIEKTWQKYMPGIPLEYDFLDETFNRLYKKDHQTAQLILGFALIAIAISALGLFSLTAFAAEQRTREIGIRKILGASVPDIVSLLSKDFLKLVLLSIIIATPIAWWAMTKWLNEFAYRITMSWWLFGIAGLLAVLIAAFTISFQAIKAAVANPIKNLRTE